MAAISRAFLKSQTLLISQGSYSTIGACHFGQAIMAALLDEEAANAAQRDGNMNARLEETDSRFLHRAVRKFYWLIKEQENYPVVPLWPDQPSGITR